MQDNLEMTIDLCDLQRKYPYHFFCLIDRDLFCDGQKLCKLPEVVKSWGLSEKDIEMIIDMEIKLIDDPTYFDYENVRKRIRANL